MKRKTSLIFALTLALALLLTACADYSDSVVTGEPDSGATVSDPAAPEVEEEQSETPDVDEELAYFQELLESDWYRNALTSFYTAPAALDLYEFFHDAPYGYSVKASELSESERAYYVELLGESFLYIDNACITAAQADEVLTQYFGITMADTLQGTLPNFTYDPKHDSYLHLHGDTNMVGVDLQYGIYVEEDTLELYYMAQNRYGVMEDALCVVTLRDVDGTWQVVSNLPVDPLEETAELVAKVWESLMEPDCWWLTMLASEFTTPEEMDPWAIFSNQPADNDDLTDAEKEFLRGVWGEERLDLDVTRVPASELDTVLRQYAGITLEELEAKDGDRHFPYFAETDCYYLSRGAIIIDPGCVELLYAEIRGSYETAVFHYLRYGYDEFAATFSRTVDGGWYLVSNVPIWEE